MKTSPTLRQAEAHQGAFDYFNSKLFEGKLPPCILNFSRLAKSYGFFRPRTWTDGTQVLAEISLNPDTCLDREPRQALSTLVHEMVHLWQEAFGHPPNRCYHNREWADKMQLVGLVPSSTGKEGGKRTGVAVTHYVLHEGPYDVAFRAMPPELMLPWRSSAAMRQAKKAKGRGKYVCPGCEATVYGRRDLNVICGDCDEPFEREEGDDAEG